MYIIRQHRSCRIQVDQATSINLRKFGHFCVFCLKVITIKHIGHGIGQILGSYQKLLDKLECYLVSRKQARAMLSLGCTVL